jgi:hypothetical protein
MPCRPYRLVLLLLLLPVSIAAQVALDDVARRLEPRQILRLHSQGGQRIEGRFVAYSPEPPLMRVAVGDTTIPFGMIDSVWVRRTNAKSGAIIGALVLGVPSAVFWGTFCSAISDGSGCQEGGTVAGLALAGAGVGALLGAAIGSASSHWQLRYALPSVGLRLTPLPGHRIGGGISFSFQRAFQ